MPVQMELDQLAAAEYGRLQKQLRTLKIELQNLLEDKSKQLKKQSQLIAALHQEHQGSLEEIQRLGSGIHARQNNIAEKKLFKIQTRYVEQRKAISYEKSNLSELEGRIKKLLKEIEALRTIELPDSCYKESISRVQKSVVKLENRLDVVNKKYSDVLTDNGKLRASIDHMLQDRTSFNEMWQSMVTQFNEGKKYIIELIDQSTLAFDQREELSSKLQTLKDRNENDKLMHIQEMREMQRRIEHDAKLQTFFDIKGQKRINLELEQRIQYKKQQQKEHFERKLLEYRHILQKIKSIYKEDNTDRLVAQFKKHEEENFALFNYVNELSHEVEILNDATQELRDEIKAQKLERAEKEFKKKSEHIDDLEEEYSVIQTAADYADTERDLCELQLNKLLGGIQSVFLFIHCDNSPILNVLSATTALTVYNVKLLLGVIERRINLIENKMNANDLTCKILAKKDRVPKFNIKDTIKAKNQFLSVKK